MKIESFWGTSTDDYSWEMNSKGKLEIAKFTGGALFVADNGKYVTVYVEKVFENCDIPEALAYPKPNMLCKTLNTKVQVGENQYLMQYSIPGKWNVSKDDIYTGTSKIKEVENISREEMFSAIHQTERAVALAATWSVSKDIREQAIKEYKKLREEQ